MSKKKKPTYKVSIRFDMIDAKNPLEAAKEIAKWLKEGADSMIFDIEDEATAKKFSVDLSEEDEDAVIENKSNY